MYKGREEREAHSGTVRSSEISLTGLHTRIASGGRLREEQRWLVVLPEGEKADSVQARLSSFRPLWFLVGEKDKEREQCGVGRV